MSLSVSLIRIHLQSNTCCILSSNILSTAYFSWKLKLISNHLRQMSPPHRKQSIGRFLSETYIGVKRINKTFLFQKNKRDVFFQINAQSSLLFSFILKMKFQRIYRCNHWNVFNKDCSEKCCSRMMLFCSSGTNSWKILCIFESLLFKKLTLSEVLSKILNKVLWLLFWVAASNVVKTNGMMIAKFTINAI